MQCSLLAELPLPPEGKFGWPWSMESPQLPEWRPDGTPWPRISIVTPSFNQGAFLEETIRSVLLQGYPNLEYFVIDGASSDNSVEIIRKYEPWLSGWVSEKDRGQSHAINKGFERCTGDLITFQNSDDYYLPGAFRDAADHFMRDNTVGTVVGAFRMLDQDKQLSSPIPARLPHRGPLDLALEPAHTWRLHQVSTFFSRKALDIVGRYVREELRYVMDRELLYRVCARFPVTISDTAYAVFRRHKTSKTVFAAIDMGKEFSALHRSFTYTDQKKIAARDDVARLRFAVGYLKAAQYTKNFAWRIFLMLAALRFYPPLAAKANYWRMAVPRWLLHFLSGIKRTVA